MNFAVTGELAGWQSALWLEMFLNMAVKGSLLLTLALGLGGLLRADLPARRSRVWTGLFFVLIALPEASLTLSLIESRLDAAVPWTVTAPVITVVQAPPPPEVTGDWSGLAVLPANSTNTVAKGGHDLWSIAILFWLIGASILLVRLALRLGYGWWLARRSSDATDNSAAAEVEHLRRQLGLRRTIRVGFCATTSTPFVTGLQRHHLVLPEALADWEIERLRPILLHELAHLQRRDLLRLVLGDLACALYWFQPLVWYAARRSVLDQELACDDAVCGQRIRATDYARILLGFVTERQATLTRMQASGFARASGLEKRLLRILARPRRTATGPARWLAGGAMSLALVSTIGLMSAGLVASTGDQPPTEAKAAPDFVAATPDRSTVVADEPTPDAVTIHQAAIAGDVQAVFARLARDPSRLDARDAEGMTPLALAAWHDHPELVKRLLTDGADPDLKNHNGLTPLFSALDRGRRGTARLLIENGAETASLGFNRRTLLHMAARAGDRWTLERLLARGADINARDHEGLTPLDLAVWGRKSDMVDDLVARGARRSDVPDPRFFKLRG